MLWPDEIRVSISGGTCVDVEITDGVGRPVLGVVFLAITYRPQEIGSMTVERVDEDGPIVDGELPTGRRTYLIDADAARAVLRAHLPVSET